MKASDLMESERKVWEAAITGALVDLRAGNSDLDSPERWSEWAPKRIVRAEFIAALLIGNGEAASVTVRGVRLQGARVAGEFNLEAATLRCPLALLDCAFASAINLAEATAQSIHLSGSHLPAVQARLLRTSGDLKCDSGFRVSEGIDLTDAHIGGKLSCEGSQFSHSWGFALSADGLTVEGNMFCSERFVAMGEVRLQRAHIKGALCCTRGQFSHSYPGRPALVADGLIVEGSMFCNEGFVAMGEVRLLRAHIKGSLGCIRGQFSHPEGCALLADGLTVEGDMFCSEGFVAMGEVRLPGAHIKGMLSCRRGRFSHPGKLALSLQRATVDGPLFMESAMLEGILDLSAAKAISYHDDRTSWPQTLRLNRFVYEAISDTSTVKERLKWLQRNESGYSPQIYEQLAAVYHRAGNDEDARRVLLEKQRRRSAQGNPVSHALSRVFFDCTVGYGYSPWKILFWLGGLWILGAFLFGYVYRGDLKPAKELKFQPPFDPWIYTLDLLFPVANLHLRDTWIATGAAFGLSTIFIVAGWALATIIVLGLTGILRRDLK